MHYNPFAYLHSEKDILKLVNTIMVNTKGEGEKSSEDFWTKAEKLYYTALIGYIYYEAPEEEKNFTTLLDMINASEAREDDEDFKNPVDLMFDRHTSSALSHKRLKSCVYIMATMKLKVSSVSEIMTKRAVFLSPYGGRLPVHVRCLLDEVANIGQIPKLEKLIATIRSREISACLILQAQCRLIQPIIPLCYFLDVQYCTR